MIQSVHNPHQMLLRYNGIILNLRDILPDQSIRIFVCTSFPGGVGVSKKEISMQNTRDPLMIGKLPAIGSLKTGFFFSDSTTRQSRAKIAVREISDIFTNYPSLRKPPLVCLWPPNGLRYPQVDRTRWSWFDGICSSTESTPFGGVNPICRVHAGLGRWMQSYIMNASGEKVLLELCENQFCKSLIRF